MYIWLEIFKLFPYGDLQFVVQLFFVDVYCTYSSYYCSPFSQNWARRPWAFCFSKAMVLPFHCWWAIYMVSCTIILSFSQMG